MKRGPVAQTGLRRRTLLKDGAQASEAGDPGFKSPRARQYQKKLIDIILSANQRQKIRASVFPKLSVFVFFYFVLTNLVPQ